MGCTRGSEDVFPRAGALVYKTRSRQFRDCGRVIRTPLRLQDRVAVPVDPDPPEVLKLPRTGSGIAGAIQILDPHQKLTAAGTREEPREQSSAEISEVKVPGGARSVASCSGCVLWHRAILPRWVRRADRVVHCLTGRVVHCPAGRVVRCPACRVVHCPADRVVPCPADRTRKRTAGCATRRAPQ